MEWLYSPQGADVTTWRSVGAYEPFSDQAIEYLSALSSTLMRIPAVRTMPDVATFAFFCRKASLLKLKQRYATQGALRLGRGVVFHIAPSNVPVNFAYSMVCGVLAGNCNVVRVPSKPFAQVETIVEAMHQVTDHEFAKRIALVRYERGGEATDTLSALCDVRVIWGGDQTIASIRRSPLAARAFDVTFADRYSFCAIDAHHYLEEADAAAVAEAFYNDTYLFDQNACSAPHLVVWRGREQVVAAAKKKFWSALYDYTAPKYELAEVLAVDKLTAFYTQAVAMDIHKEAACDNLVWRVEADSLPDRIDGFRCKAGYFTEHRIDELHQVAHIVDRKYQTLAYYGFQPDELNRFVVENRLRGLDRLVPIGKTTEFDVVWDGYNLIDTLSRVVTVL